MKPTKASENKTAGKTAEGKGADASAGTGGVFDERRVKRLIKLMKRHDLSEIDLQQADERVRIRRGGAVVTVPADGLPGAGAATARAAGALPAVNAAGPGDADGGRVVVVTSPMVGTFYRASGPDAASFVKVGDRIEPEKTVCIIEAMKVFNEIPAGVSGQVVAILVENGAPVEFGQPLLKVDPEH
ncbi:MAG: acetyl-CoA carboxylase biotin carboxyl carrier protein [Planctomycetia bacterium]|nr:acetyl-CoA carboxylase biotin carboxyl carrier protein [Planctomycetia bacterium]